MFKKNIYEKGYFQNYEKTTNMCAIEIFTPPTLSYPTALRLRLLTSILVKGNGPLESLTSLFVKGGG